jgi:RNA polymerase sigma-70 factor (ECF subfamily)
MRSEPDTDQLLSFAANGDMSARNRLLERNRGRLRQLVAVRLDRRLAARIDPSDVVQETLADAANRLDKYLNDRPLPFYPWLRQIAQERMADVYRRHIRAVRRSVTREEPPALPGDSVLELADRLLARESAVGSVMNRRERRQAVQHALDQLSDAHREVLVLRFLEDLSTAEAAAVLEIGEGAVKMRVVRALERLKETLEEGQL